MGDPNDDAGPQRGRRKRKNAQALDAVPVSASGTRKRRQGSSVNTKGLTGGEDGTTREHIKSVLLGRMAAANASSKRAYSRPRAGKRAKNPPEAPAPAQLAKPEGEKPAPAQDGAPVGALNRKIFAFVDRQSREQIPLNDDDEPAEAAA